MTPVAQKLRRRCSVEGCTARVKGRFKMCRACRMFAAVRKASSRAARVLSVESQKPQS